MGKKAKSAGEELSEDAALFRQRASELRVSGDVAFGQSKCVVPTHRTPSLSLTREPARWPQALALYDQALTLTPDKCSERALILSNRAACFLKDGSKLTEAIKECSSALEAEPGYERALLRRARAYELAGLPELALHDLEAAVKGGCAEALRSAQRVKAAVADSLKGGKGGPARGARGQGQHASLAAARAADRSALVQPGGGGASYASSSTAVRLRAPNAPPNGLTVKVTLDGITKAFATGLPGGYPELLAAACAAFPGTGPLALRYLDTEGDMVTLCSRVDIRLALHAAVQRHMKELESLRAAGQPKPAPPPGSLPPLHLSAIAVGASPQAPREELGEAAPAPEATEDIVEIDEWMLDLSAVFRARLGLPEGATVDIHAQGLDHCCEVLEEIVGDEAHAPLLDAAATKFQEAAAAALFNWGNVHCGEARKRLDATITAAALAAKDDYLRDNPDSDGVPIALVEAAIERTSADSLEEYDEHFALAKARWAAAAEVKADYLDPSIAWGQQAFERAKLRSSRAKEDPPRCSAAEVDAAYAEAAGKFRDTLTLIPAEPVDEDAPPRLEGDPAPGETSEAQAQAHNVRILLGNVLFEHSQVSHARGDPQPVWQPLAEQAVCHFKAANCQSADIERALKNHPSGLWKTAAAAEDAPAAIEA